MYVVKTFTNIGLIGYEIQVESDANKSLPTIDIIGLPDASIKEAKERIRATFRNTGIELPRRKIIINLAPSDIRKVGTRFDVPMAVAILSLIHEGKRELQGQLASSLFFGELGLDGSVKRVNGLLPTVISAIRQGYTTFFVPYANSFELQYLQNIIVYPMKHFNDVVMHVTGEKAIVPLSSSHSITTEKSDPFHVPVDFCDIKGQGVAKRALSVAAAGLHNVLMVGSPGSGKTMLAKALHGILPPLGFEEILQVSQIYSVVGKLHKNMPLILQRPFRQVHHTASRISIIGGGRNLTPGEVSLAHQGVLFFDELPEFPREVLEVLRQPIEDKTVAISRVSGTVSYPANFMFVATMNPSPCGYYNDPEIPCKSSYHEVKRYQAKVSGPLLDRIDMLLEIPREKIDKILDDSQEEDSESLRNKVQQAWSMQQKRYQGTPLLANADLSAKHIKEYIPLAEQEKNFIKNATKKRNLSTRVVHRMMKLARTIADMEGKEHVKVMHLAEALQYRNKNMFIE